VRRLKNLSVHEVSLVKQAANKRRYLVAKAKGASVGNTVSVDVDTQKLQMLASIKPEVKSAIAKAVQQVAGTTDEATQGAMHAAGNILAPHVAQKKLTPDMVAQLLASLGWDDDEDDDMADDEDTNVSPTDTAVQMSKADDGDGEDEMDADGGDDDEDTEKSAEKDDPELEDEDENQEDLFKPKAKKKRAKAATKKEKDVTKSATPPDLASFSQAQRTELAPVFKAFNDLQAAHKVAVAKSEQLQDKLDRKEFVAKAAELKNLGNAEELGEKLHTLHKASAKAYEDMHQLLKAANAQLDANNSKLFGELGSSAEASAGTAADEVRAKIDGLVQKSAGGKTREQIEADFYNTAEGAQLFAKQREEEIAAQRRN
jgi:hypothetical protein